MPANTSTLDGLLKDDYGPMIRNTLPTILPFLDEFEEAENVQWQGREHLENIHVNRNRGGIATAEGGPIPVAGQQQYENLRIPCRYNHFPISLTEQVILATRTDKGAFARGMRSEMDGALKDIRMNRGFYMVGNGSGVRCLASGAITTTAFPVDSPGGVAGATHGTRFLNAGDTVQAIVPETGALRGTTGFTIARLLAAGTGAVTTAAATVTDNDYIVKVIPATTITVPGSEWQKVQMGALGMFDNATYLATYFGLSRADFPHVLNSTVIASVGPLSADVVQRAIDVSSQVADGQTKTIWSHHSARRAYLTVTETDRRYTGGDLRSPDAGTAAAKKPGGSGITFGGIPWECDSFFPYGFILGHDNRASYRFPMDTGSWNDRDGSVLHLSTSSVATYEAFYQIFDNFANLYPAQSWVLSGVTVNNVVAHVV